MYNYSLKKPISTYYDYEVGLPRISKIFKNVCQTVNQGQLTIKYSKTLLTSLQISL